MSFGLTRRSALLGAVAAATGVAVPGLVPGQRKAHASLPGAEGAITFRRNDQILIANADGSDEQVLVDYAPFGSGGWSPDGSRFVYATGTTIESVRQDGSDRLVIVGPSGNHVVEPTFAFGGAYIVFSNSRQLFITPAAGNDGTAGSPLFSTPPAGDFNNEPTVSVDGKVAFAQGQGAQSVIRRADDDGTATTIITGGAWEPDFSPDGTQLAFSRLTSADGSPTAYQVWIADADGANQVQLTTEATAGTFNLNPTWTPAGDAVAFTSRVDGVLYIRQIDITTRQIVTVVEDGFDPTFQPVNGNTVERVWGATALGTAVATSRYNWADKGVVDGVRAQAKAVVLSRDDMYFDALGGSALAVSKQGPLLITPTRILHADTQAELQRILAPGGTVYLLGGTVALSEKVDIQVKALGYQTVRLWGQSEYDTAVAVAKAITPNPTAVIIATSLKYYDALAAGAAAGANPGTVIVLTAGDTMPAATAAYLNGLNPDPDTGTAMIGVGGPGVRALINGFRNHQMPNWPGALSYHDVSGATEFETAVAVAEFFFTGPGTAAVATATTWFDALTGGAMIGANLGPLLLSAPGTLSAPTRGYFSRNSSTITYGVLLGGPLALKNDLIEPLGDAISVPGAYDYAQYTETFTTAKAMTLRRSTAHPRAGVAGRAGDIPGTRRRPDTLGG